MSYRCLECLESNFSIFLNYWINPGMYKLQLYKPLDWQDYLIHLMLATRMYCSPLPFLQRVLCGYCLMSSYVVSYTAWATGSSWCMWYKWRVEKDSTGSQSLGESFRLLWIRLSCMHCDFQAFLSDNLLICHVSLVCKLFCDKIVGAWFDALFVLKILKMIGIHFCPVRNVSSTNTMAIKVT